MISKKDKIQTIDEYICTFPDNIQKILEKIRQAIKDAAPDAEETISYQIPTFKFHGNLVHFGAFKNHIGFYPTPDGLEKFKKEFSVFKSSKGAVQFPIDKPIPLQLVGKVVRYRVKENLERAKTKKKKGCPHQ